MCGICGILGGSAEAVDTIYRMTASLRHRGPDDQGVYHRSSVALGMTRLAIQDLSPTGHQPMSSPNGDVWIVYNGEMYNAPEERRHLEALGYEFRSTSDTEVLLTLYRHYGEKCLSRVNGIFAFAIVDFRESDQSPRIFLARDQLGVKPLLVARLKGGGYLFASELKAILASGLVMPEIDPRALRTLFETGAVTQPLSMIRDVAMLPPAHFARISDGAVQMHRYWSLNVGKFPELHMARYEDQVDAMRSVLRETVRGQLLSDVPVGAFLSGGVDSATLTALMAAEAGAQVRTFSVGFGEGLRPFDESSIAERFATYLGTKHQRFEVNHHLVRTELDNIVESIDQPSVDGLNTYFVSKCASKSVKVAISGTGGDDLFMGYPWHAQMLRMRGDKTSYLARYADLAGRFHNTFRSTEADLLVAPGLLSQSGIMRRNIYSRMDELPDAGPVERLTALTLRGYTKDQLLRDIDVMSMAHSLEVRVPYLDTKVIDTALSLPIQAKLGHGLPTDTMRNSYRASGIKRILVDVARPLLPKGFDGVPKRGFGIPFGPWLHGPLRDVVVDVLAPHRVSRTGIMNSLTVDRLVSNPNTSGWRLWLMLITQLWGERMGIQLAE